MLIATPHGVLLMHAAYLIYSCQYKSHEFNWHSYRKTGKSLSIIIEKVPCMQWWEREPSDERGWACFSSCIWNAVLAVHFLLATVLHRSRWTDRLMPLYNIVAWTLPIMMLLPLLIVGNLGYTPTYQTSCYIANNKWNLAVYEAPAIGIVPLICAVTTALCYTFIIISLYRKVGGYNTCLLFF